MNANRRPDRSLRPAMEALAGRDRDIARHYRLCGLPPLRRQFVAEIVPRRRLCYDYRRLAGANWEISD